MFLCRADFLVESDLRNLYMKVVKRFHPDLVQDELEKKRYHEIMVAAGEAYARGDEEALQYLFQGSVKPRSSSPPKQESPRPRRDRHDRNPDGSHARHCSWCDRMERR